MARRVFFSFHYDDVTRANVVRNSDQITRRYDGAIRFYDKSLWEEAKKQGSLAIKRMINRGLKGSSVTCVLIGQHTWHRRWVRYEILKSLVRGNGIVGVNIHDVGFSPKDSTNELALLLGRQPAARPTASVLGTQAALAALLPKSAVKPTPAPSPGLGTLLGGAGTAPPPTQPAPGEAAGGEADRKRTGNTGSAGCATPEKCREADSSSESRAGNPAGWRRHCTATHAAWPEPAQLPGIYRRPRPRLCDGARNRAERKLARESGCRKSLASHTAMAAAGDRRGKLGQPVSRLRLEAGRWGAQSADLD